MSRSRSHFFSIQIEFKILYDKILFPPKGNQPYHNMIHNKILKPIVNQQNMSLLGYVYKLRQVTAVSCRNPFLYLINYYPVKTSMKKSLNSDVCVCVCVHLLLPSDFASSHQRISGGRGQHTSICFFVCLK